MYIINVCACTYVCTSEHVYVCSYVHMHRYLYMYTDAYTHIHIHTSTHTHTHAHSCRIVYLISESDLELISNLISHLILTETKTLCCCCCYCCCWWWCLVCCSGAQFECVSLSHVTCEWTLVTNEGVMSHIERQCKSVVLRTQYVKITVTNESWVWACV